MIFITWIGSFSASCITVIKNLIKSIVLKHFIYCSKLKLFLKSIDTQQKRKCLTDSPANNTSLYPGRAGRCLRDHWASTVTLYRNKKIQQQSFIYFFFSSLRNKEQSQSFNCEIIYLSYAARIFARISGAYHVIDNSSWCVFTVVLFALCI